MSVVNFEKITIDLRAQKSIESLLNSYENTIENQTEQKLIQIMGKTGFRIPDLF